MAPRGGVLEPGGGSLVVASDYDRALSPLITEAAAKPTSIGGPFAAQDLGIPCLLSMNMAVPSLSSRLSPDLVDNPAGQCLLLGVKQTFNAAPQRVRL